MPIYVTVVKLTSEGMKASADLGKRYKQGKKIAAQRGIKTIGAYALLGRYDMMFIYEALDEKAAMGMPLSFASDGSGQTETWTAIPLEDLAKITGDR